MVVGGGQRVRPLWAKGAGWKGNAQGGPGCAEAGPQAHPRPQQWPCEVERLWPGLRLVALGLQEE